MVKELIKPYITSKSLSRPFGWDSIPRDPNKLWLDKNENIDREYNNFVHNLSKEISFNYLSQYPEPAELYRKLSKLNNLSKNNFILTPGSDGAIKYTFDIFVNPGDRVMITSPSFAMYDIYCKMYGAIPVKIEYKKTLNGPKIELEDILYNLKKIKPKLFCLPNPDSPTGTILGKDQVEEIIRICKFENIILLLDEAYFPYYNISYASYVKEFNNVIISRTFSKAWGLAGLRLGYAIGNKDVIQYYHKIKPMYEIGAYSIAFIEKMIDHIDEMNNSVDRIMRGKDYFLCKMRELNFLTLDNHANFLHVSFGNSEEKIYKLLSKSVLYRRNFQEDCLYGFSRFTSTTIENFKPIIKTIESALINE